MKCCVSALFLFASTAFGQIDSTSTFSCANNVAQVNSPVGGVCTAVPKLNGNTVSGAKFDDFQFSFTGGNITNIDAQPSSFTFSLAAGSTSGVFSLDSGVSPDTVEVTIYDIASSRSEMNCTTIVDRTQKRQGAQGINVTEDDKYVVLSNGSLQIKNFTDDDFGQYRVINLKLVISSPMLFRH